MKIYSRQFAGLGALLLCLASALSLAYLRLEPTVQSASNSVGTFRRVATFEVKGSVAEIVAAAPDGRMAVYTNVIDKQFGFVDLTNPAAPVEVATLTVNAEPNSVAVTTDGRWALGVTTLPDALFVIDMATRVIVRTIPLGGQPDAIDVSPDGRYAAIAIENERNETLNLGRMPQGPAGFITIVDLVGAPNEWTTRDVAMTGLAARFGDDPEPEFIDINAANQVAITLQENNHIVIVNLADGKIITHWSAGTTAHAADVLNDGNVNFNGQITNARREPDAIAWTPGGRLLTANEGDYTVDLAPNEFAGSRDFTIFNPSGGVVFEPGAELELAAVKAGHYQDARSRTKGIEPEGAATGVYQGCSLGFIGSERGNFVAVYDFTDETRPVLKQILPTGAGPEGLLALPQRNLLISADEVGGSLTIYEYTPSGGTNNYPQVISDGVWWSALSGLDYGTNNRLYAVPNNAVRPSRIYTLAPGNPVKVEAALALGKNYDLEGIAVNPAAGWWVVSEGANNAGALNATPNLLVQVNQDGTIAREIELPVGVSAQQRANGFKGVATNSDGSQLYVVFQREWNDDPLGSVKIGRYTPASGEWAFFRYPLDAAPAGGWVGLSEITRLNDTTFVVVERDNLQFRNARVKRLYTISVAGVTPVPGGMTPPTLSKTLYRDLLAQDGFALERIEGVARSPLGDLLVVNDNGGFGETRWLTVANPAFDTCLQDERSGDVLRFHSLTGAYAFARCGVSGFVATGRATLQRQGCELRLHDARLNAVLEDCVLTSVRTGVAELRLYRFGPTFTLQDRNLNDNLCLCR